MGFILIAPVYYYTEDEEELKPSQDTRWGIVEFVDGYRTGVSGDLAPYINKDEELYGKIKHIYYNYDNKNQIIVFRVRLDIEEQVDENGKIQYGCYCGRDYDYLKPALLEYINGQISDGWAENGILLVSYWEHTLLEARVEEASFYEPDCIEDCITFEH